MQISQSQTSQCHCWVQRLMVSLQAATQANLEWLYFSLFPVLSFVGGVQVFDAEGGNLRQILYVCWTIGVWKSVLRGSRRWWRQSYQQIDRQLRGFFPGPSQTLTVTLVECSRGKGIRCFLPSHFVRYFLSFFFLWENDKFR